MKRLLIIDDDPDVRLLVSGYFKKNGFEVETACHKDEALEKIQQFKPTVILLDVLLSGTDGRNFCREMKEKPHMKEVIVIMFSAHPAAAESIQDCGAADFIAKPFSVEVLLQRIEKHVADKTSSI